MRSGQDVPKRNVVEEFFYRPEEAPWKDSHANTESMNGGNLLSRSSG